MLAAYVNDLLIAGRSLKLAIQIDGERSRISESEGCQEAKTWLALEIRTNLERTFWTLAEKLILRHYWKYLT